MKKILATLLISFTFSTYCYGASKYTISNNSPFGILVIMDTDREQHPIPPFSAKVFVKANPVDQPTFHVFRDNNIDNIKDTDIELFSKKVPIEWAFSASGKLVWTGVTLEDDIINGYIIHNNSKLGILVIMDTNREIHSIAPLSSALFVKANLLDQPTFHVYKDNDLDGKPDNNLQSHSKKVPIACAQKAGGVLSWDGANINISCD